MGACTCSCQGRTLAANTMARAHQSFLQIPACRKHTLGAVGRRNTVRAAQPGGSHDAPVSRLAWPVSSEQSAAPGARSCAQFYPSFTHKTTATAVKHLLGAAPAQHCVGVCSFHLTSASEVGTVLSPFCRGEPQPQKGCLPG